VRDEWALVERNGTQVRMLWRVRATAPLAAPVSHMGSLQSPS